MEIVFKEISKFQYNEIDIPILFSDFLANRCYGIIAFGKYKYKFAWQSDLIKPHIINIEDSIYSIGIDQNIAIINFNIGRIIFNKKLDNYYIDIKVFNEYIYIISELEVIKLRKNTYIIDDIFGLPDLIEKIECLNDEVKIYIVGGKIINI